MRYLKTFENYSVEEIDGEFNKRTPINQAAGNNPCPDCNCQSCEACTCDDCMCERCNQHVDEKKSHKKAVAKKKAKKEECDDDDECKDDKKESKSSKGLTAAQKKLPKGLQAAILKRKK